MFTAIKKTVIGLFTIVRSMWMVNSHAIRPRDTILYPEVHSALLGNQSGTYGMG